MTETEDVAADAAKIEATQIMADKASPYWDQHHAEHRATVDQVAKLLATNHGETSAIDPEGNTISFNENVSDILQAPDDPKDYDFSHLTLGKDETWNEELESTARGWFHELNVSVDEQRIFSKRFQQVSSMPSEAREKMVSDATISLGRTWGTKFDENVEIVETVINHLGDGFRSTLIESGMNNDVGTINALLRIGRTNNFRTP